MTLSEAVSFGFLAFSLGFFLLVFALIQNSARSDKLDESARKDVEYYRQFQEKIMFGYPAVDETHRRQHRRFWEK